MMKHAEIERKLRPNKVAYKPPKKLRPPKPPKPPKLPKPPKPIKPKITASEERRRIALWRYYKMTPLEYASALQTQGGRCAICRTDDPGGVSTYFAVDHDHTTGEVRGLLCGRCNLGLGFFRDSLSFLAAAQEYLKKHKVSPS